MLLTFGQLPITQCLLQFADRLTAQAIDREIVKANGRGVVSQAAAATSRTFDFIDEVPQAIAQCGREPGGFVEATPKSQPAIESCRISPLPRF